MEEKTTAYRGCLFISSKRLPTEVWYKALPFLCFAISVIQHWLFFEGWIVVISWLSQMWMADEIILLS